MDMIRHRKVGVVFPALNEEQSIGKVAVSIPDRVDDIDVFSVTVLAGLTMTSTIVAAALAGPRRHTRA